MRRLWTLALASVLSLRLLAADAAAAPGLARDAPAVGRTAAASPSPLDALSDLIGGDQEILPPDEAFRFSVMPLDAVTLSARWMIADGYYLYRDKMQFTLKDASGISLGTVLLPAGEAMEDEFFGRVKIYRRDIQVSLPLTRTQREPKAITLEVKYQGCAEAGICYPPITKTVDVKLSAFEIEPAP